MKWIPTLEPIADFPRKVHPEHRKRKKSQSVLIYYFYRNQTAMALPEDFSQFEGTLKNGEPDPDWPDGLIALWHDGRGDWEAAHDVAQDMPGSLGSRIHAYLHRKEGDRWNAGYWYRRSGTAFPGKSLEDEFRGLVAMYLPA